MVQTSYPGVYVEEFAPAPPIQPAGTSVAAFVGVAAGGDINVPTRVTSFNQFVATYGARPINGFYLWYAVRGFFENGGQDCFVVRASNGRYARDVLLNANNDPVFKLRTVQPGDPKISLTITAATAHQLTPDRLRVFTVEEQPVVGTDPKDTKKVILGPGASGQNGAFLFRPGDVVEVKQTGEQATVLSVDVSKAPGAAAHNNAIRLDRLVNGLDATKSIQLAPVPLGALSLTMEYVKNAAGDDDPALPAEALVPGALLTIGTTLSPTLQEVGVIDAVGAVFLPNPTGGPPKRLYQVQFRDTLNKGLRRDPGAPIGVRSEEFTLTITPSSGPAKTYANLATDPLHPRYAPDLVNARDATLRLEEVDPPPPGGPDKLLPADGAPARLGGTPAHSLVKDVIEQGADEDLTAMPTTPNAFIDALNTLTTIPDVFNVAIPDVAAMTRNDDATAIQQAVVAHCENMGDRFGVLDALAPDQDPFADKDSTQSKKPDSIETQRGKLLSARGYAALYYPWIRVLPASRGPLVSVPPSGHVCGLYARIDNTRGVHKAPAREPLFGTVAIARDLSNVDHGVLNLQGINVIRTFTKGGQPVVFGARTTTSDTNWQYVNVRRLFLFLERSITANLRSTVFEPNTTELWGRLNRTISAFLLEQWHNGALFGAKPDQAFYVKIDETLNPFTDRQLGKLTIEIGVQPTYPAEFIIVRIGIWDGVSTVQEG